MQSIKSNESTMKRVRREMEQARFPEEKKKIWEKTVTKEVKDRQNKKKSWQNERKMARSVPIKEDQQAIEVDTAQQLIDDYFALDYGCNCSNLYNEYYYCDYDESPPTMCYTCEHRLYNTMDLNKKEPRVINMNINCIHPWGNVNMKVEYDVQPVPTKAIEQYKKEKEFHQEEMKSMKWFEENNSSIMKCIHQLNNYKKSKSGIELYNSLVGDSDMLKKYFNIIRNKIMYDY
jgi:hypothetical protein